MKLPSLLTYLCLALHIFTSTPSPTPSPTRRTTGCVEPYAKCGGASWTGDTHCCEPTFSCFTKDASYSQCELACPTGTGWACDTPVPSQKPTGCVDSKGKCAGGASYAGDTFCCETDEACFPKTELYSQCRDSCPDDDDWLCHTQEPTPLPTGCVASRGKCAGGASYTGATFCCEADESCFQKTELYSQCRDSCPDDDDWLCDTPPPTAIPTITPSTTLREAGSRRGMKIGGVVKYKHLIQDAALIVNYTDIMAREFSYITAENGCKWRYQSRTENLWCDTVLDFATASDALFRNHALVWGKSQSNPDFFCEDCVDTLPNYCDRYVGNWSKADKRRIMIEHVKNITTYYKGTSDAYDVVNEAVCDCNPLTYDTCADYLANSATGQSVCGYSELYNTYLKKNIYWPDIEDYIGEAFTTARIYDPDARLGYNEYKFESCTGWQKEKCTNVYNLMKSLVDAGVDIDYVGSQTHIQLDYVNYTDYLEGVENNTAALASLGLQVDFTEVTVACNVDCTEDWDSKKEDAQSTLYAGLLRICLNLESCSVFQIWGGIDGWSGSYANLKAFPFDTTYKRKKAWYAMMDVLDGNSYFMNLWEEQEGEDDDAAESEINDDGNFFHSHTPLWVPAIVLSVIVCVILPIIVYNKSKLIRLHEIVSESIHERFSSTSGGDVSPSRPPTTSIQMPQIMHRCDLNEKPVTDTSSSLESIIEEQREGLFTTVEESHRNPIDEVSL